MRMFEERRKNELWDGDHHRCGPYPQDTRGVKKIIDLNKGRRVKKQSSPVVFLSRQVCCGRNLSACGIIQYNPDSQVLWMGNQITRRESIGFAGQSNCKFQDVILSVSDMAISGNNQQLNSLCNFDNNVPPMSAGTGTGEAGQRLRCSRS